MAQVFDRSSNALARLSLVLTGVIVIALGVTLSVAPFPAELPRAEPNLGNFRRCVNVQVAHNRPLSVF